MPQESSVYNANVTRVQRIAVGTMLTSVVAGAFLILQPNPGLITTRPDIITLGIIALVAMVVAGFTVSLDMHALNRPAGEPSDEEWEKERLNKTMQALRNRR